MNHAIPHTRISFTLGSAMLLSALTLSVCLALLMAKPSERHHPGKSHPLGSIEGMTDTEVKEAFGAVNQTAAMEAKHGLFGRLLARRSCQSNSSCSSQSWNQTAGTQHCGTSSCQQYGVGYATYSQPRAVSNCSNGHCYPLPPLQNSNCANGTCHPAIPQTAQPAPQAPAAVPRVTKTSELRIIPSI